MTSIFRVNTAISDFYTNDLGIFRPRLSNPNMLTGLPRMSDFSELKSELNPSEIFLRENRRDM